MQSIQPQTTHSPHLPGTVFVRTPAAQPKRASDSKVAQETSIPPVILAEVATPDALVQVLEWHWPELAEHVMVEHDLMIEMSLPPLAWMARWRPAVWRAQCRGRRPLAREAAVAG